jgi:hypothetical protein
MSRGAILDHHDDPQGRRRLLSNFRECVPSTWFSLTIFDSAELRRHLSDEILAELSWEDEMAEKTKRLYRM